MQNIGVLMALVRACSRSEIPVGGLKFINVAGRELVICNVDGKFYALNNWCTHEQGNLSDGELKASILTCPEHGAQFDAATGRVILGPDGDRADTISPEKSYKVMVQGSDLMIEVP